jgi:dienelactone hydrolase
VAPLPPTPWRDGPPLVLASGTLQWIDAGRDRSIVGRWIAPGAAQGKGLLIVLPSLAQGSNVPTALAEGLAGAGFVVLAIGHPGNDAAVWQSPEARRADFNLAARRMYSVAEVAERGADVRFVLDALEREPPSWLPRAASARVGVIGIGLGAQTTQWLLGEQMARNQTPVVERRVQAVALLGPYVGFEGPAMHQRYGAITTPMLLAYGLTETDPYGLGMTSQQRRAMVDLLVNARVIEVRLPAVSLATLLTPGSEPAPAETARGLPPLPGGGTTPRGEPPTRGGRAPGGGTPPMAGGPSGNPTSMPDRPSGAGSVRNQQAVRVAVLFSLTAFFESELLGSADAREWLEGPHPGPALWTFHPAGRTGRAPVAGR